MQENQYWNLYVQANHLLDVIPYGPRYGVLTIFPETQPTSTGHLRKCMVTFINNAAIRQWGVHRDMWLPDGENMRDIALAHLNGER